MIKLSDIYIRPHKLQY